MRKVCCILTGIFLSLLFTTCKQFTADIDDYLSYWSTVVSPAGYSIDKPTQMSADGSMCVPSADNLTVTVKLNNPKNVRLIMPDKGNVIHFPGLSTQPVYGTDYTLAQKTSDTLTLEYKSTFLRAHECGKDDIGSEITLTADDGRVFKKKFSINLKVNTAPVLESAGIAKAQIGSEWYYVLLFRVKDMDTTITGSSVHKDIAALNVTAGDGTPVDIPLTFNSSNTDFATRENLLAAANDIDTDSPIAHENWVICLKTDVKVGEAEKEYAVSIKDAQGLSSAVIRTSTKKNKLSDVQLFDGSTEITGTTEAAPALFADGGKTLTAKAHNGAAITGKLKKKSGSEWNQVGSDISGTTTATVNLPVLDASENEALYKISLKASAAGYTESDEKAFYVKVRKAPTINGSDPDAWKKLKDAVQAVDGGGLIIIDGEIKATSASGNNGEILIDKNLTIQGATGAATDILNANSNHKGTPPGDAPTTPHRIFKVESGKTLTLENLTLTGGKADGAGEAGNGGAIFARGAAVNIEKCTLMSNTATTNGGGIYAEGAVVNITNCTLKGNSTPMSSEAFGGAIYAKKIGTTPSTVTISGGFIGKKEDGDDGNKAKNGGGIWVGEGCILTLNEYTDGSGAKHGVQLIGNQSNSYGGGVCAEGAAVNITNCTFKGNTSSVGGAICAYKHDGSPQSVTISGGAIGGTDNDKNEARRGGGIYVGKGYELTLEGSVQITGNNAKAGSGVYVRNSSTIFRMKESAKVNTNNDVYLAAEAGGNVAKITIDGILSPEGGTAAHITVPDDKYNSNTQVLEAGSGVTLANETYKFAVTPKEDSGNTYYWEVDNQGKLIRIVDGAKPNAWKVLKDTVEAAVSDETITIKGEIKATNASGNSDEIEINKNLTIKGKTKADSDILDANGNHASTPPSDVPSSPHRIFKITGTAQVHLENLTLQNGKDTTSAGTTGAGGGGIFVPSGKVELTDCIIENCTAGDGGAIGVKGEAKLTNTVIKKCAATTKGGAIFTKSGKVTMTNCTLTGNTAKNGGAIAAQKDTTPSAAPSNVTISGGTIGGTAALDANEASKSGTDDGGGGGIYINNSTLKLQNNAKVIGNKASVRGGGIYVGGTDANFTMESGEISSNTVTITESAEIQGGGVCVIDGAKFEMKGGSIKSNTVIAAAADNAKARGGGVCVSGSGSTFIMKDGNPEIINNEVTKADGSNSSMKITTIGGGICVWDNAKFEMQQGTISGNKALTGSGIRYFTGAGGGVCVGGKGDASGAGYTNDTAEFKMSGGTISKNEASSSGGGVAVMSRAQFTMTNGTIGGSEGDKNTSKQRGGGVAVLHGTFEMQNGTVSYNQATTDSGGAGGGVYGMNFYSNTGSIIIKGSSSISNNTAMYQGALAGGGIAACYKLTIEGAVKIMNNKAPQGFGGGIACSQDAQVELKGCTVKGNTAKELQYGHGVYISYFYNTSRYFKMSGDTKIHKDNNVALGGDNSSDHAFITVTEHLSVNDPNYYPSLTMNPASGYSSNRVVVKPGGSYMLQASDISKFKVTPGGDPQKNWKIVLEGGVGKLKTDP